jgi:hypothetical protein
MMMWDHFIGRHTDEETHGFAADINRKLTARLHHAASIPEARVRVS